MTSVKEIVNKNWNTTAPLPDAEEIKLYHSNGTLSEHGFWVNGYAEGVWNVWNHDGQLIKQMTFLHGKRHGEYKEWWDNGQLAYLCHFEHGNYVGERKGWTWEGILYMQEGTKNNL